MTRRRNIRDRWYWYVIRTDLVNGSCRELLALVAVHHMTELGHVRVPRSTLADQLGVAEPRITRRMSEAVNAGLLDRVAGGVNAQTVTYAARFPNGQGVGPRHPQPKVEVTGERHPQNDTQESPPGCRSATPIRARISYKTPHNGPHHPPERGSRNQGLTSLGIDRFTTHRVQPIDAPRPATGTDGPTHPSHHRSNP